MPVPLDEHPIHQGPRSMTWLLTWMGGRCSQRGDHDLGDPSGIPDLTTMAP